MIYSPQKNQPSPPSPVNRTHVHLFYLPTPAAYATGALQINATMFFSNKPTISKQRTITPRMKTVQFQTTIITNEQTCHLSSIMLVSRQSTKKRVDVRCETRTLEHSEFFEHTEILHHIHDISGARTSLSFSLSSWSFSWNITLNYWDFRWTFWKLRTMFIRNKRHLAKCLSLHIQLQLADAKEHNSSFRNKKIIRTATKNLSWNHDGCLFEFSNSTQGCVPVLHS